MGNSIAKNQGNGTYVGQCMYICIFIYTHNICVEFEKKQTQEIEHLWGTIRDILVGIHVRLGPQALKGKTCGCGKTIGCLFPIEVL